MFSLRIKRGVFWLEGLNAISTTWYFYFIFFFLEAQFAFDKKTNLLWAAALGAVFTVAAVLGGRAGQRLGYLRALAGGFGTMAVAVFAGAWLEGVWTHFAVLLIAGAGMCFTWPNLEAMIAEGENPVSLQRKLGIYNLVWSAGNAVAYFTGGMLLDAFGARAIFFFPAVIFVGQLLLALRLQWTANAAGPIKPAPPTDLSAQPISTARERRRSPVPPAVFMKMAWVANPFSYVAINTAVPLIPFLAGRLELSPTAAGIVCSTWIFSRTLAFALLWKWDGWHYRYRFLAAAYLAMVAGFMGIVLAGSVAALIGAQVLFGLALGLIYYSSLFYSMDVGDTKGDHGGLHEGSIGAGLFAGPAIAVASLHFFPGAPNAGVIAVGAVLLVGFLLLNWLRWRRPA
ncbi:MAG TPA: hypothetical protein DCY13_08925 [Verrucomicrobiales bacterium]|nr:hypothetical protein [Verrucomicrobiales bacterium]